jgi:hypothetical protein
MISHKCSPRGRFEHRQKLSVIDTNRAIEKLRQRALDLPCPLLNARSQICRPASGQLFSLASCEDGVQVL